MTKGKLTKVEQYAISGMSRDGLSAKEISKELGRTVQTVKKYLSNSKAEEKSEEPPKVLKAKDLVVNKTKNSKNGVSIFTRAASERSDESKKEVGVSRISKDAIFRPLDN